MNEMNLTAVFVGRLQLHLKIAGSRIQSDTEIGVSIGHLFLQQLTMPADQNQPDLSGKPATPRYGTRLIVAVALIGVSIVALWLLDRFHALPAGSLTAPHEPAQALITTPALSADEPASTHDLPAPQKIVPASTAKSYVVQFGVFNSPANAHKLQRQLQQAGIKARLETRVQLGPFKNKHDADQAIARAKKLGIEGVVVGLR